MTWPNVIIPAVVSVVGAVAALRAGRTGRIPRFRGYLEKSKNPQEFAFGYWTTWTVAIGLGAIAIVNAFRLATG